MSCKAIRSELVAYHFGVLRGDARSAVEAHLIECRECLQEFLDVKRAVETGEDEPRPARAVRDRLRRAVAEELSPPARRPWTWWERPAAIAFAGCAVLAAMIAMHALTSGPGSPPYALTSADAAVR